jgi:hypothetical protein
MDRSRHADIVAGGVYVDAVSEKSKVSEPEYRWVNGVDVEQAEWDQIEGILAARGWMSLNRETCRILIAEQDGQMAFNVVQFMPFLGPLFLPPSLRGTGLAEDMVAKTVDFMQECNARGWMAVAESPHAIKLCENQGKMKRVGQPVYATMNPGEVKE